MNELTFELLANIVCAPELNEELTGQIAAYLEVLGCVPYLSDSERKNALILLEFLDSLEETTGFRQMIHGAMAKLRMDPPEIWTMEFPENYSINIGGQTFSAEDLKTRGIEHVDFKLTKPIRDSIEYIENRRLHADGSVEHIYEYQVFDREPVGERHLFNVYGEKAVATRRLPLSDVN